MGAFGAGRARRHHVVDQQNTPPSNPGSPAISHGERPGDDAGTGFGGQIPERNRAAAALQGIQNRGAITESRQDARQQGSLIEPPRDEAPAMQGNRDDHVRIPQQRRTGACQEHGQRPGEIGTIGMLERQQQATGLAIIAQGRASAAPWPGVQPATRAQTVGSPLLHMGERRAAAQAKWFGDEAGGAKTCRAQTARRVHRRIAGQALWRQQHIEYGPPCPDGTRRDQTGNGEPLHEPSLAGTRSRGTSGK